MLPKAEEQLMEIIWKNQTAFMKDILEEYSEPKPAGTTVSTLLKRLQDKDFVGYKTYGNSREYFPKVKKDDYFSKHVNGMIKNYFNDSAIQFASFFTTATDLTKEELKSLRDIIDGKIKNKTK